MKSTTLLPSLIYSLSRKRRSCKFGWSGSHRTNLLKTLELKWSNFRPKGDGKLTHETLTLIFGNVTTFGQKVQDWIWTRAASLLLLQETHLGEQGALKAKQYFSCRGWKVYGLPGHPTGQGGNTKRRLNTSRSNPEGPCTSSSNGPSGRMVSPGQRPGRPIPDALSGTLSTDSPTLSRAGRNFILSIANTGWNTGGFVTSPHSSCLLLPQGGQWLDLH